MLEYDADFKSSVAWSAPDFGMHCMTPVEKDGHLYGFRGRNEPDAWLACYGILSHGFGMMFIASSLPHVTTTQAGLALLLQPTLSFTWDVLFFARPMTSVELLGAAIALFAIYLGSRARSEQAQSARK